MLVVQLLGSPHFFNFTSVAVDIQLKLRRAAAPSAEQGDVTVMIDGRNDIYIVSDRMFVSPQQLTRFSRNADRRR